MSCKTDRASGTSGPAGLAGPIRDRNVSTHCPSACMSATGFVTRFGVADPSPKLLGRVEGEFGNQSGLLLNGLSFVLTMEAPGSWNPPTRGRQLGTTRATMESMVSSVGSGQANPQPGLRCNKRVISEKSEMDECDGDALTDRQTDRQTLGPVMMNGGLGE